MQWPRYHALFLEDALDPLLVGESIRQGTILTCHLGYGVPLGHRFLMTGLRFQLVRERIRAPQGIAREVVVLAEGRDIRRSAGGQLQSIAVHFDFVADGRVVAVGAGIARIVNDQTYRRSRGDGLHAQPPRTVAAVDIAPSDVGRRLSRDVVVRRAAGGALGIVVAGEHPFFYDHPLDHVPGMAIIEACCQAAYVTFGAAVQIEEFEGHFDSIVEFSEDTIVELVPEGDVAGFAVVQGTRARARGELRVLRRPTG